MELSVAIFMGKMDVKYVRMKCYHGTKCHAVGLAKNAWTECSVVTFNPQKMFKMKCSGVDKQSICIEINVTVDAMNSRTLCWVDVSRVSKHY